MSRLGEVIKAGRSIFAGSPTGSAYVEYVDDMRHVLEDDEVQAFVNLERVCLGDGAMEARDFFIKQLRECRECHGEGYTGNGCHYAHGDYEESTCDTCGGSGEHLDSRQLSELYVKAHPVLEEWHEDSEE